MSPYPTFVAVLARTFVCVLIAMAQNSHAQTAAPKVEITKFGTYDQEVVTTRDPNVAGSVNQSRMRLLEQTSDIPGKVGVAFGIWYKASAAGNVAGEKASLIVRVPGKGIDVGSGKLVNDVTLPLPLKGGTELSYGFKMDTPAEVVPGTWTFEIWMSGAKVAEQSFNIR